MVAAVAWARGIRVLAVLAVVEDGGRALVDRVDATPEADDERLIQGVAMLVAVVRRPVGEERRGREVPDTRRPHHDLVRHAQRGEIVERRQLLSGRRRAYRDRAPNRVLSGHARRREGD